MRVIANLAQEFEEVCQSYYNVDEQGKDIVILVGMFADECDHFDDDTDALDFRMQWDRFLGEHAHQVTSAMVGLIIHTLSMYWPQGQQLCKALPPMEKILWRETVQEISEVIKKHSEANGDAALAT